MYAVVRTGGKQLRVKPGDVVAVERLPATSGEQIELREVLMLGSGEGDGSVKVGTPLVAGAVVRATITGEVSGEKIRTFKYKRRKRYRLTKGHRQHYHRIKIDSIEG